MKSPILLIDDEYVTLLIHERLIKGEDPDRVIYTASNGKFECKNLNSPISIVHIAPKLIWRLSSTILDRFIIISVSPLSNDLYQLLAKGKTRLLDLESPHLMPCRLRCH